MDNRPIGVFDSGWRSYRAEGDKKFVASGKYSIFRRQRKSPYGSKSKETVVKYTFQDIRFLLNQDIKMIVIACNTASACSLDQVKNSFDIPIVEVVGPGAATAVRETVNKKVGVIGTVATVSSGFTKKPF